VVAILCSTIRFRKPSGKRKMITLPIVGLSSQISAASPPYYINVPDKDHGIETA
jgi:hypothetical protein